VAASIRQEAEFLTMKQVKTQPGTRPEQKMIRGDGGGEKKERTEEKVTKVFDEGDGHPLSHQHLEAEKGRQLVAKTRR